VSALIHLQPVITNLWKIYEEEKKLTCKSLLQKRIERMTFVFSENSHPLIETNKILATL